MPDDLELSDFEGSARLFPLPDFVLFPHVVKPLHIFEPRYRQMTEDALHGDHLIALVLLKPHTEEEYAGEPDIHDTACLARIINEQRLADGKFNILVRGLCRLRIEAEVPTAKLYRIAQGWPMPDAAHPDSASLRRSLAEGVRRWVPPQGPALKQLQELLDDQPPLGALTDILAFALPLAAELKQELLEELDIEQRARRLIEALREGPEELPMPRERPKFPPDFSLN
jgi:Lon protease-like protein